MKTINQIINEKFIINKNSTRFRYFPNDKNELIKIIHQIEEDNGPGTKETPIYFGRIDFKNIKDLVNVVAGTDFEYINVDGINIQHINNFSGMFQNCKKLKQIDGLESWKLENCDLSFMFYNCKNLENIDISTWDLDSCDTNGMFTYSRFSKLKNIKK